MTKKYVLFIAIAFIVLLAGAAGAIFFLNRGGETFTVTFTDSKLLRPGAQVYLAGIDIGKVSTVDLIDGTVNVTIMPSSNQAGKIPRSTQFFIDTDIHDPSQKCVLAMIIEPGGEPIRTGDVVQGTDSALAWKLSQVAGQVQDAIASPQARRLIRNLELVADDFKEKIQAIDWDQVGKDIHRQTRELIEDIDYALRSEEMEQHVEQLDRRIARIRKALQEVGESDEVQQLGEALGALVDKLNRELERSRTD